MHIEYLYIVPLHFAPSIISRHKLVCKILKGKSGKILECNVRQGIGRFVGIEVASLWWAHSNNIKHELRPAITLA